MEKEIYIKFYLKQWIFLKKYIKKNSLLKILIFFLNTLWTFNDNDNNSI